MSITKQNTEYYSKNQEKNLIKWVPLEANEDIWNDVIYYVKKKLYIL